MFVDIWMLNADGSMSLLEVDLHHKEHFRIIPSVYPPINFFEDLVDPDEMETLWEIEALTNERLREQIGELCLVTPEDRVCGPGSSIVMAAFTHIGKPSRFTNGSFGVYYASLEQDTAISETVFHREKFLAATSEDPCEISMRMYKGKIKKTLIDIRGHQYKKYHHPENYTLPQQFGEELKKKQTWGILYNSVRHAKGQCIALLRPPATNIPIQIKHLRYVWNGECISTVFDVGRLR